MVRWVYASESHRSREGMNASGPYPGSRSRDGTDDDGLDPSYNSYDEADDEAKVPLMVAVTGWIALVRVLTAARILLVKALDGKSRVTRVVQVEATTRLVSLCCPTRIGLVVMSVARAAGRRHNGMFPGSSSGERRPTVGDPRCSKLLIQNIQRTVKGVDKAGSSGHRDPSQF